MNPMSVARVRDDSLVAERLAGMTSVVSVTVCICTWSRCDLLRQTLAALTALVVPRDLDWEVLVVNNNSTDATEEVVQQFSTRLPIRSVLERAQGHSHARNRGLREAPGKYIVFTDDDVLVDPGWLRAFVEGVERYPEGAAFGGPIEPWFPSEPDPVLVAAFPMLGTGFCGLESDLPEGPLSLQSPLWGANMAFNQAKLQGITFDPNLGNSPSALLGGEDVDFLARLRRSGGTAVWLPQMRLRHYVHPARMSLAYLTQFVEGRARALVRERGVPGGICVLGIPRWLLRRGLEAYLRYVIARLTRPPAEALVQLRALHEFVGMIKEYRLMHVQSQRVSEDFG